MFIKYLVLFFCFITSAFSATPLKFYRENAQILNQFSPMKTHALVRHNSETTLKEMQQSTDFNQTNHVRYQQMYKGYPIWGAEAIMHVPAAKKLNNPMAEPTTVSGILYQNISQDLTALSPVALSPIKAIEVAKKQLNVQGKLEHEQANLIVYIDSNSKAHWAYLIELYIDGGLQKLPTIPKLIIDANNSTIYKNWNDLKTLTKAKAGGYGGNIKMGKMIYDGLPNHLPLLNILRDDNKQKCLLSNEEVVVKDFRFNKVARFDCKNNQDANNFYWNKTSDEVNGGFSPNNDALYAGSVVKAMYEDWYHIPVLFKGRGSDIKPLRLEMITHSSNQDGFGAMDQDNAYWDSYKQKMYFGDGAELFYPLTTIGIAAHEISHGFTDQHSQLSLMDQAGGINEAFSDMAAQAVEFYIHGKNSWEIAAEITKEKGTALRYMAEPTKDCNGNNPGEDCSIDHVRDYQPWVNMHYSSGIFNRAFYLIATAPGWNVKKAFDIMVQANRYYWTSNSTFEQAACGVMQAARDYRYKLGVVQKAFADVGLDTSRC